MTSQEILKELQGFDTQEQVRWMIDLGIQLTIFARDAYPLPGTPGSIRALVGLNELQHQIYGRIRHLNRGEEWTNESFLNGLVEKAQHYEIATALDWSLQRSLTNSR